MLVFSMLSSLVIIFGLIFFIIPISISPPPRGSTTIQESTEFLSIFMFLEIKSCCTGSAITSHLIERQILVNFKLKAICWSTNISLFSFFIDIMLWLVARATFSTLFKQHVIIWAEGFIRNAISIFSYIAIRAGSTLGMKETLFFYKMLANCWHTYSFWANLKPFKAFLTLPCLFVIFITKIRYTEFGVVICEIIIWVALPTVSCLVVPE